MSLTDSLPALPDITGNHSYPASTSSTSGSGTVSGTVKSAIGNVVTGGLSGALGLSVQSIVFIILGLLFIAAGIFAFREVRQTVVTTAKTTAKAALIA